jgi:hypothetical protein
MSLYPLVSRADIRKQTPKSTLDILSVAGGLELAAFLCDPILARDA